MRKEKEYHLMVICVAESVSLLSMNPTALNTSAFLPKNKTHSQDEMLVGSLNIAFILEEEKRGCGVHVQKPDPLPAVCYL